MIWSVSWKKPLAIRNAALSQLQRLVLVVLLLKPHYSTLKRQEFRDLIKSLYWGTDHTLAHAPSVAVSLSRALSRLEERGFIERFTGGGWKLTSPETDFVRNGYLFALGAWEQEKDLYAKLGLFTPTPPKKGVQVTLKF